MEMILGQMNCLKLLPQQKMDKLEPGQYRTAATLNYDSTNYYISNPEALEIQWTVVKVLPKNIHHYQLQKQNIYAILPLFKKCLHS